METLNILEKKENINWDYDEEADVLYLSFSEPQNALGLDIGDGTIVRYNEKTKDIVGLTIISFRERMMNELKSNRDNSVTGK